MQVRAGTPRDIAWMMRLAAESPGTAQWQKANYEQIFSAAAPVRHCLLAEHSGNAIAFIVTRELDGEWELENLAVAAGYQRQGIATRLLQEMLALAAARRAKVVFLEVRESNLPARTLYERNGFRLAGRRVGYYSHPVEDALTYRLSFPQPGETASEPR